MRPGNDGAVAPFSPATKNVRFRGENGRGSIEIPGVYFPSNYRHVQLNVLAVHVHDT